MPSSFTALFVAAYFVAPGYLALVAFNAVLVRQQRPAALPVIESVTASMVWWLLVSIVVWSSGVIGKIGAEANGDLTKVSLSVEQPVSVSLGFMLGVTLASVVGPLVGGWGLAKALGWKWVEWLFGRMGVRSPVPQAWDKVFGGGDALFVRAIMKDGSRVGGLIAEGSFASSCPANRDLYIPFQYELDDDGRLAKLPIPSTAGIWLDGEEIKILEFYEVPEEKEESDDDKTEQ